MWTGGAEQFQDRYPYVWFVMGDWAKAPFYPTDPPRTPGAFYESVAPVCDFPLLGNAYQPFISQYALYYDEQWTANPPGTSTSTANPPTSDEDSSLAEKVDLLQLEVAALHTKVGTLTETDTLASLIYYLITRVGGTESPPPLATSVDTARLLAALYYIAQSVIVPAWAVDNEEVLDAITAAKESIKGVADRSNSNLWDAFFDGTWGAIAVINGHTDGVQTSVNNNVDAAETAILDALVPIQADTDDIQLTLAEGVESSGGGNYYPGSANVTPLSPTVVTGPAVITGPMDGIAWSVTAIPNGQSTQGAGTRTRYKGLAFLAFMTAEGDAEELQSVQWDQGILKPLHLLQAASCAVYCKAGTSITMVPYTINTA